MVLAMPEGHANPTGWQEKAKHEVIEGARTFSMIDRPDRLVELLSTIAVPA